MNLRAQPLVLVAIGSLVCVPVGRTAAAPPAQAAATSAPLPTIVLESNVGERPPDAAKVLLPLYRALEGYGFYVDPGRIAKLLGQRAPLPAILDKGVTAGDIARQVEIGLAAFRGGKFEDAEQALTSAVRLMKRNPGLWVLDGTNATQAFTAMAKLSVAQLNNGHAAEAARTMLELIRMSDRPVTKAGFGSRAAGLYQQIEKTAHSTGRATLSVAVSDKHAVVFLDGVFKGIGSVNIADLMPGPRRLYVQVEGEGRQHEITLSPDETSALDLDWQMESAVSIDEAHADLVLGVAIERKRETDVARRLAREWGAQRLIVIAFTRLEGTLAVEGKVYPADGSAMRRATVAVSDEDGMRSLARFLYDGTLSGKLAAVERPTEGGPLVVDSGEEPRAARPVAGGLALGAGTATIATGAILYLRKPYSLGASSANGDDGRDPQIGIMLAGAVALGGGTYLWLRESQATNTISSLLLAGGVAATSAGAVLYFTNQDGGPQDPPRIRHSGPMGLGLGIAGLAAIGAGVWQWRRDPVVGRSAARPSMMPVVAWESRGALLGCVGRF